MSKGLINGEPTLFIDQYGQRYWARSVKELKSKVGVQHCSKMYLDKKDGSVVHCGYVLGEHWLTAFKPVEVKER